jgi:hypothetical protein
MGFSLQCVFLTYKERRLHLKVNGDTELAHLVPGCATVLSTVRYLEISYVYTFWLCSICAEVLFDVRHLNVH